MSMFYHTHDNNLNLCFRSPIVPVSCLFHFGEKQMHSEIKVVPFTEARIA